MAEAWANIYAEYADLNKDNQTVYLLQLQKEIALLSLTLAECEMSLYLLSILYREELVAILKGYGYDYPFDPTDSEQYVNSLEAVHNRLSPIRLKLSNAQKEYQQYVESHLNQTVEVEYFDKMLVRLSRFYHMLIRASEITVKEFVLMLQEYLDYIQAKKQSLEPETV